MISKWYRLKWMVGFHRYKWYYWAFSFYWFSVVWNNVHPEMYYSDHQLIPWHGFTFYWGPDPDCQDGDPMWKHRKELLLWQ